MASNVEFELVKHSTPVCNIFIVNMLRRAPHVHRDFEMCLLLDGAVDVLLPQNSAQERVPRAVGEPSRTMPPLGGVSRGCLHLQKGDVWVMNPFQTHALNALNPAQILAIQFSPALFSQFWPEASNMRFMQSMINGPRAVSEPSRTMPPLGSVSSGGNESEVRNVMIQTACIFFDNDPWRALLLSEHIIRLFRMTAAALPHRIVAEKELLADKTRSKRVSRLSEYIDANCTRKLLLKEVAKREGLSMAHLSHFFSSAFGMPFQEYLARVRCEKARLMMKEHSALDLFDVSLSCGFSDVKYFNRAFKTLYRMSPAEYKAQGTHAGDETTQGTEGSLHTEAQAFLSPAQCLELLKTFPTPP